MAITSNTYTGNGSNKLFSITFPYLETADINVYLNGTLQTVTTQYTFANATTVEFVVAPGNGTTVLLNRSTDEATIQNTFFPGSSIKANDLNDNFDQVLYLAQETNNNVANAVAGQIPDGTITNVKLAANSVASSNIIDGTITNVKLAANSVASSNIIDGTIVNADVNASAGIATTKLAFTQAGTGATARTVDSKLKDVVSVKDFGAVGDGAANDTAAIKAAILAAIAASKSLFFPAGTYLWSDSTPFTIQPTNNKGLIIFGEGRSTTISINQNNTIFNVISGDTSRFICNDINFTVTNTGTNNNVTVFYVTNGTSYGAWFGFQNCTFTGAFTGIHGIRAGGAYARSCNFYSTGKTNGSACVRLWGADGTATSQDHSFSNFCNLEQCNFNNATYGFQGFGLRGSKFTSCVFQGNNIGISNVRNSDGIGGIASSTTRCGYGGADLTIDNCWSEDNTLSHYVNTDVNYLTGAANTGTVYQGNSTIFIVGTTSTTAGAFIDPKLVNGTPGTLFGTSVQSNFLTVTVPPSGIETRDLILGGNPGGDPTANTVGAIVSVSAYGGSGTGTANAMWQVGGFLNDPANCRITQIINAATAGFTLALAYQAAGTVRLTLTNGLASAQYYKVSIILNKSV